MERLHCYRIGGSHFNHARRDARTHTTVMRLVTEQVHDLRHALNAVTQSATV